MVRGRTGISGRGIGCFWLILLVNVFAVAEPVQVDLSMNTGRNDTGAPGWFEWQVPNGAEASVEVGDIGFSLYPGSGSQQELKGQWFKAGLDYEARMATDGVTVSGGPGAAGLILEIAGLEDGRHTLVCYFNTLWDEPPGPYKVSVVDQEESIVVMPGRKVLDDLEAKSVFLSFSAREVESVRVKIESEDINPLGRVILNGFELDVEDPARKARRPVPARGDWHVDAGDGQVELSWEAAKGAQRHMLHVVSGYDPVALREVLDGEVRGPDLLPNQLQGKVRLRDDVVGARYLMEVDGRDSLLHYAWRVDTVHGDGSVTRGDVWKFRCRQLAFPGAEGYGRFAIGGRGGQVIPVTNLNDSGPGSLRAAVEADGPRTVVFDVSGRIELRDRLEIRNPYITIAGQTAPGKGICLSDYGLAIIGTHDVIVRFLRVRPGDLTGRDLEGVGIVDSDHVILDHLSISWAPNEGVSSRSARNITLQRSLIAEGLRGGPAAGIGGNIGSYHHNLLAHNARGNWGLTGGLDNSATHTGRLDVRNNVIYNWVAGTADGGAREVNYVGNYYKPGPASQVFHVLQIDRENIHAFGPQDFYVSGNVMEGHYAADSAQSSWAGIMLPGDDGLNKEDFLLKEPLFPAEMRTQSAEEAYAGVLEDVGCNVPELDDQDRRLLIEVREGSYTFKGSRSGIPGHPDSQQDVGGWENYPVVYWPEERDRDGDGIPDVWELEHGLNPKDHTDGRVDSNGDGYTNLETYLNWLATGADSTNNE